MAADPDLRPINERPNIDQLVDFFDTIVFGSEFGEVRKLSKVRKWKRPLRVVVREYGEIVTPLAGGRQLRQLEQKPVQKHFQKQVLDHLTTLAGLTGLKTQDAGRSKWPANFIINFVPPLQLANPKLANVSRGLLQRLASQGGCYFITWPDKKGDGLQRAVIVVNKARNKTKTNHCILEEMTQSLGLPNDSTPKWPSIFSNTGAQQQLSWTDRHLVRALYDQRMVAGTPRIQALKIARELFTEQLRKHR